jgi:NitT/TauT family transport system substrate-binding protein
MVYGTGRFREANPKTYAAFLDAMREAMARIQDDKPGVAKMYLELTRSKETEAAILAILNDPQVEFTMTPKAVMKFADFMHSVGSLKNKPASWKEIFTPEIHHLPGG